MALQVKINHVHLEKSTENTVCCPSSLGGRRSGAGPKKSDPLFGQL
jgi:hypothetical protein